MTHDFTLAFFASSLLAALARGWLTGVVVSLPTGPVNVAVIRNSISISKRMGLFLGAGAAVTDATYSLLVFLGFGRLVRAAPWIEPLLGLLGCALMIGYGLLTVVRPTAGASDARRPQTQYARAFGLGVLMTVANPGPLLAWVVIAPAAMGGLDSAGAFVFSIGVLVGGVAWFAVLSELAHRGIMKVGRGATVVTRFVGGALVAFGIYLGVKAYLTMVSLLG